MTLFFLLSFFSDHRQDAFPDEAGGGSQERSLHPPELAPSGSGQLGENVRDPREDFCGHGEAQG